MPLSVASYLISTSTFRRGGGWARVGSGLDRSGRHPARGKGRYGQLPTVVAAGLVALSLATVALDLGARPAGASTLSANWAQQSPATSPPASESASMAFDPATGDMVLFGGYNNTLGALSETWTWDGSNWAEQSPATSPPARPRRWRLHGLRPGHGGHGALRGDKQQWRLSLRYLDLERDHLGRAEPGHEPART